MVSNASGVDHYASDFQQLQGLNDNNWVSPIRSHAMETFAGIGLPTTRKGNEKWKYTNVAPIARIPFALSSSSNTSIDVIKSVAPWSDSWTNVVFVNGFYRKDLSDQSDEFELTNLAELIEERIPVENLGSLTDISDDGFAALNTSFLQDGIVLKVEKGKTVEFPINVVFFSDGSPSTVAHPRIFVKAGRGSSVSVIENYVGGGGDYSLTNSVSEILVEEDAVVNHYRFLSESEHTYDVGYGRVKLSDNSVFNSRSFFKGANIGRYDLNVLIDGEYASCDLQGLYFTSGDQHMDNFINIDHAKPYGTSNLFYKGILDGKSRAVFGGTVLVRKPAQKTDSVQSDKNLILSADAEVDSKPALFIYADDVKCAHGATAGNVDADTLFYMRSRGIDLETASRLLIYGFAGEVIDKVEIPELRVFLEEAFLTSLPSYKFEF